MTDNNVDMIMCDMNKLYEVKRKHIDPELKCAYALGAYEVMQYIKDVANGVDNAEGLKRMIRDEYDNARQKLFSAVMEEEE